MTYVGEFDGTYRGGNVTLQINASRNSIEGVLSITSESRRAVLTGKPHGLAVDFSWKTERPPDGAWYPSEEGHGLLILQTPTTIVGYRRKGTSRDALDLGSFIEFTVIKSSEP
jgi:hypothetical protein